MGAAILVSLNLAVRENLREFLILKRKELKMRLDKYISTFTVVFSLLWTFCLTKQKVRELPYHGRMHTFSSNRRTKHVQFPTHSQKSIPESERGRDVIPPWVWINKPILNNHDFIKEMLVLNENMSHTNVKQLINNTGRDGFIKIEQSYSDHMANVLAPSSGCEPKPTEVAMPVDRDPYVIIWPACTPVPRCGGCCGNPMLVCAPTLAEKMTLKVLKVRYRIGTSNFEYQKFDDVVVEKHLACKCQCRVQPYDCNSRQYYHEPSCSCKCKREYMTAGCYDRRKVFDEKSCECVCAHREMCDDGYFFDENICRCISKKNPASYLHRQVGSDLDSSLPRATQAPQCLCPKGFVSRPNRVGGCVCRLDTSSSRQVSSSQKEERPANQPPVPVPVDQHTPNEEVHVPVEQFGGDFGFQPPGLDGR
ncbi:uncharacterized protein LOC135493236 isoform X2 [Lineus longissimus]|uniref:uncharacterized protein LOC135493236 isoform X2 n=1 Tax=Lineus longissimus TaxID=88925 RepID=UPI00315D9B33